MSRVFQYRPSSGTEGADFEAKWCQRCLLDADFRDGDGNSCPILANALAGLRVAEWRYWRGDPVCTEFEPSEPGYIPYLRGNAVADLFPGARRSPSAGTQVRMLVQSATSNIRAIGAQS